MKERLPLPSGHNITPQSSKEDCQVASHNQPCGETGPRKEGKENGQSKGKAECFKAFHWCGRHSLNDRSDSAFGKEGRWGRVRLSPFELEEGDGFIFFFFVQLELGCSRKAQTRHERQSGSIRAIWRSSTTSLSRIVRFRG